MERVQKKCLIASVLSHSALVVILIIAPAFVKVDKPPIPQPPIPLILIPSKVIDGITHGGGGSPAVQPPQPQPPVQQPPKVEQRQPEPEPPKPAPEVVRKPAPEPPRHVEEAPKVEKPRPVETAKPAPAKPKPVKVVEKPKPTKPKIEVNLDTVVKNNVAKDDRRKKQREEEKRRQEEIKRAAKQQAAWQAKVADVTSSTVKRLQTGLSSSTSVEMPGPGGEAFVNYAQWVKEIYERNWLGTDTIPSTEATVKVEVVVSRNGSVVSSRIVRKSGNTLLDRSVQGALNRVRSINYPFPDGARENTRTFIINFDLASKRYTG